MSALFDSDEVIDRIIRRSRGVTSGHRATAVRLTAGVMLGAAVLTSCSADEASQSNTKAETRSPTATPSAPSFADLAPSGVYRMQQVVLASNFDGEKVGATTDATWTFAPRCTDTSCAGTIESSDESAFSYDWDGSQLTLGPIPPSKYGGRCVDQATGKKDPQSRFKATATFTVSPLRSAQPVATAAAGPPQSLSGTLDVKATYKAVGNCRAGKPSKARYEWRLAKEG